MIAADSRQPWEHGNLPEALSGLQSVEASLEAALAAGTAADLQAAIRSAIRGLASVDPSTTDLTQIHWLFC